jgi:hypothetical protein
MTEMMIPFRYVEFYDVPRCIVVCYRGTSLLLLSAFDNNIDEYPDTYVVYVLPKEAEETFRKGSWKFIEETPMHPVGEIRVDSVKFDESKRKEFDSSCLDDLAIFKQADGARR